MINYLQVIIRVDEDPSLGIESFAITNLHGVSTNSTKLNYPRPIRKKTLDLTFFCSLVKKTKPLQAV